MQVSHRVRPERVYVVENFDRACTAAARTGKSELERRWNSRCGRRGRFIVRWAGSTTSLLRYVASLDAERLRERRLCSAAPIPGFAPRPSSRRSPERHPAQSGNGDVLDVLRRHGHRIHARGGKRPLPVSRWFAERGCRQRSGPRVRWLTAAVVQILITTCRR